MPKINHSGRHLIAVGLAAQNEGADFDPAKSFRACLLCGAVFQSDDDDLREIWAEKHARKVHSEKEHVLLAISGSVMTPEAANKLAAFGVIPITDMVLNEEVASALFESTPNLSTDAET